ncbi:phosphatase 2C family protein [Thalictrum thalictroides]|uniref:Phosphatase 2C family protein n=2 Tax=Thalictrum thalictroides TaxID=46969 RepID=A0A7J6WLD7_THATH|nr:phosphatase 2C family protein [Thalictrum thalictroides]
MALKDLHRKIKAFRVSLFLTKDGHGKQLRKNPLWMTPVSHGIQVVEDQYFFGGSEESVQDFAVAQREQIKGSEVWLFGVFDAQIGDKITKYLQINLFDKELKESQIKRKSRETMKKAFLWIRAKLREEKQANKTQTAGCASVIVINGEKIVAANMGDYRVVVCKEGVADQICERHHPRIKRRWSINVFSGTLHMRIRTAGSKLSKHAEPAVASDKIDSDTEFVILASSGIWQVMKNQEAVNLIRHIHDPKEAAECLAKEALTRMSKGHISCLIIRFD